MNRTERRPRPGGALRFEIDRRRFLALAGTGAALGAVPSLARETAMVERPMSVGYLEGSDRLASLAELPWQTTVGDGSIVPAVDLPSGDPELALEQLIVRVAGAYPGGVWPRRLQPRSVALDVLFEPFDPYVPSPLPFAAWSFRADPAPNPSPPVRFTFPMGASDGLGLRLRVQDPQRRSYEFAIAFTADDTERLARLCRGIYFLSLYPGTFDQARKLPGLGAAPDFALASLVLSVDAIPHQQPPGPGLKPGR